MLSEISHKIGFMFKEPKINFLDYISFDSESNNLNFVKQKKLSFAGYLNDFGIICINSKLKVFWEFDILTSRATINERTCILLQNHLFSNTESINKITFENLKLMVRSLCISHFFIENTIFKMEGNWLMKRRNIKFSGLIELFWIHLTKLQLKHHQEANRY